MELRIFMIYIAYAKGRRPLGNLEARDHKGGDWGCQPLQSGVRQEGKMLGLFKRTKSKKFRIDRLYHVFSDKDPKSLDRLRREAELAVHERPRDPIAHTALACALVAAIRAGLTDDLDEDATLAEAAAAQALHLAPGNGAVMALCAPALAFRDASAAADLIESAGKFRAKLPASLHLAAVEGAVRPSI